jgi:hypothetical protein
MASELNVNTNVYSSESANVTVRGGPELLELQLKAVQRQLAQNDIPAHELANLERTANLIQTALQAIKLQAEITKIELVS